MDLRERGFSHQKVSRHPWEVVRTNIIVSFLKKYFKYESSHEKGCLLDLGCGDLFISAQIAERYPQLTVLAVDTNFNDDSVAKFFDGRNPPANLIVKAKLDLSALPVGQKVRVVLLLDVLEHVENDRTLLQQLYDSDRVDAQTLFVVTVPAFQSLFSAHDKMLGHFRRYKLNQLTAVANAAPPQILEAGYFFGGLLVARWLGVAIERLTPRVKRNPKGLGAWKSLGPIDTLIEGTLWADFRLGQTFNKLGIRLPGLSCYQVFRAPKI